MKRLLWWYRSRMWIILLVISTNSEGKLICTPDQTNGTCRWTLFGWHFYQGCDYKQRTSELDFCIIKNLDGSKSTFLTRMNVSSSSQYCLEFKYLTTKSNIDCCMSFYGKVYENTKNQSRLISTFCLPNEHIELFWYSLTIVLPANIAMINVVTESNGTIGNPSFIIKDLAIRECEQKPILTHLRATNSTVASTSLTINKKFEIQHPWILITGILMLSILLFGIVIVILYSSDRICREQSAVINRVPIRSVNLSHHFYEEPVSIILQPAIDISVYDHVRDNYV